MSDTSPGLGSNPTRTADSSAKIVISIDAMGGDQGPKAVVAGMARSAQANPHISFVVHGDEAVLAELIAKRKALSGLCDIRHAADVVTMNEKPSHALRHGRASSMWSALSSVRAGEADVAVSCGNTGALMAMSMLSLRKLPGVERPAIAILWPSLSQQGFNVMLDVGAEIRADAEDLVRYALMGETYAKAGLKLEVPRIGLLNVGTEEHKGRAELHEADTRLRELSAKTGLAYVGYVEGGDIPGDKADVIVTDGFTGNVALKTGEGTANLISRRMRESFTATLLSRLGAVLSYTALRRLRRRIDPRRVNGGVFLGLNGTVVKSHGSADATGVAAAIDLAFRLSRMEFNDKMKANLAYVS